MNIKHLLIDIPKETPFENCKLEREKYADVLTNIVNSYSDGFVLAINNKWGTGKTTFVKMWEQKLKKDKHKTVYFNAWENDFEDNPLTALMGELKTLTTGETEEKFKSTLKKGVILFKHIAPVLFQNFANKHLGTEGVKEAIVGVTKELSDVFENDVNEYAEKKKGMSEFKDELSEFIANTSGGKPVIFIVDELDRCRPNYAVSILEQIKHFFSVPNIVFVLSIDKIQLGNAVKGVYGSESIDSEEYLRRFIDLEYAIPAPDSSAFCEYLFEYYKFREFFDAVERKDKSKLNSDSDYFLKTSKILFANGTASLRQQEKIFGLARVALRGFDLKNYVVPEIFVFLAFIKIMHNNFYQNLKNKELTLLQMQEMFLATVRTSKDERTESSLMQLEGYLISFYHYSLAPEDSWHDLFQYDRNTNSDKILIDSIINKEKNNIISGSSNKYGNVECV